MPRDQVGEQSHHYYRKHDKKEREEFEKLSLEERDKARDGGSPPSHSDHDKFPEGKKSHHGPHDKHFTEVDTEHNKHKGNKGGNHDHPRNWEQHSHPAKHEHMPNKAHRGKDTGGLPEALESPSLDSIVSDLPHKQRDTLDTLMEHPLNNVQLKWHDIHKMLEGLGANLDTSHGHTSGHNTLKVFLNGKVGAFKHAMNKHDHLESVAEAKELQHFLHEAGVSGPDSNLEKGDATILTGGERPKSHNANAPQTPHNKPQDKKHHHKGS